MGIWQEVKEITVEPDGTTTENPIEDGPIFEFEKGGRLKITSKRTIPSTYDPSDPNTPSKTEVITTVSRWSTNGDWVMIGGEVVDIEVKGKTATLFSNSYDGRENRTILNKIK